MSDKFPPVYDWYAQSKAAGYDDSTISQTLGDKAAELRNAGQTDAQVAMHFGLPTTADRVKAMQKAGDVQVLKPEESTEKIKAFDDAIKAQFTGGWDQLNKDVSRYMELQGQGAALPFFSWDQAKNIGARNLASGKTFKDAVFLALTPLFAIPGAVIHTMAQPIAKALGPLRLPNQTTQQWQDEVEDHLNTALLALAHKPEFASKLHDVPHPDIPKPTDHLDAATTLAGLKEGEAGVKALSIETPARNIARMSAETGRGPGELADQATHDSTLRNKLLLPPDKPVPEGASVTDMDTGQFIVPKEGPIKDYHDELNQAQDKLARSLLNQKLDEITDKAKFRLPPEDQAILDKPEVKEAIARPREISRAYDVPYLAGSSKEGGVTYIDRRVPKTIDVAGKELDPAAPLNIHEQTEHALMVDGKMPYETAHLHATAAEREWVVSHGYNWEAYQDAMHDLAQKTEHEKPQVPPPDLYTKPYPHKEAALLDNMGETHVPLVEGLTGVRSADPFTVAQASLASAVSKIHAKLFPGAKLDFYDKLFQNKDSHEILGAHYPQNGRHFIAIALDAADGIGTIHHEGFHFLKASGQITPTEYQTLKNYAEDNELIKKYNIDKRYKDLAYSQKIEEALADDMAHGAKHPILTKIRDFFRLVAAKVREIMGKDLTATQLQARIRSGDVGQRPIVTAEGQGISAAQPPTVPPDKSRQAPTVKGQELVTSDKQGVGFPAQPQGPVRTIVDDPWAAMGRHIARPGGIKDYAESLWKTFAEKILDPDHVVTQFDKVLTEGKNISPDLNPRLTRRLLETATNRGMYSISNKQIDIHGNVVGPGLRDLWREVGDAIPRFEEYFLAKTTVERGAKGEVMGPDLDAAHEVVRQGDDQFKALHSKIMDFQNNSLMDLHSAGVMDKATVQRIMDEVKSRFPGKRVMSENLPPPGSPKGGRGRLKSPIRFFSESEEKVQPLFKSLVEETLQRRMIAEQALDAKVRFELAKEQGLARKVGSKIHIENDVTDWWNNGKKKRAEVIGTPHEEALRSVAEETMNQAFDLSKGQTVYFKDGHAIPIEYADPDVADALNSFDRYSGGLLAKILSAPSRFQRESIILAPTFSIRNSAFYDILFQNFKDPVWRNVFANWFDGMGPSLFGPRYDRWLREGGAQGILTDMAQDMELKSLIRGKPPGLGLKIWNTVTTPVYWLRVVADRLMTAQPRGLFNRAMDRGENAREAAVAGTEAAFHRVTFGGSWLKVVNQFFPFTAAKVNGLLQTAQALTGRGSLPTGVKFNAKKANIMGATITAAAVMNWVLNRDKEWYRALPRWQLDSHLPIRLGGDGPNGTTIMVPLPPLVSTLYNAIPLRFMETFARANPDAWKDFASGAAQSFFPTVNVTDFGPLQAVVEHIANYSFFKGRPLVSDAEKRRLPQFQFGDYTSDTAKRISNFMSDLPVLRDATLPPKIVDNYIEHMGTSIRAVQQILDASLQDKNAPNTLPFSWSDLAGITALFGRYPSETAQPIFDFRDRLDQQKQIHASLEFVIKRGETEKALDLIRKNPAQAVFFNLAFGTSGQAQLSVAGLDPRIADALSDAAKKVNMDNLTKIKLVEQHMQEIRMNMSMIKQVDPKKISLDNKHQFLLIYAAKLQMLAERGLELMNKEGMK